MGGKEDDLDDPEIEAMLRESGDVEADGDGGAAEEEEDDKAEAAAVARKKQEEEDEAAVGSVDKAKNWSSVKLAYAESKMNFRGSFSAVAFTNWLWYRCVRPRLEKTKSKLPDLDEDDIADRYNINDVEEVLGEFMPKEEVKKDDKK